MTAYIQGKPHDRSALILYGSETGNSQDAAEQLGRIAERLRFVTKVDKMNQAELSDLLKFTVVIFTLSTTGQGTFPANARILWRSLLRKRLPEDCLGHVHFTTFGFGDSSYRKYNWAARKLHKRLEQLGAQEIYPRGEADDQHPEGGDVTFLSWSVDLRSWLLEKYPLPDRLLPIPPSELLPPKWTLELANDPITASKSNRASDLVKSWTSENSGAMDHPITGDPCLKDSPSKDEEVLSDDKLPPPDVLPIPDSHTAIVQDNIGLTPKDHWQNVRHINLLIDKKVEYRPGDTIAIIPKNFPEDVDGLIKLMDWTEDADKPLTCVAAAGSYLDPTFNPSLHHFYHNEPPTLRSMLLNTLDITSIPRRSFFETISNFTTDPLHRTRLLDFTNPAFSDEFFDYTTRPRRSILEVLYDFPTVRLPWRWAPYIFPTMRARQFSICSGGRLKHPTDDTTTVHICVAVVQYRTVLKKIRRGLCSRYLASIRPGTPVSVNFERGAFKVDPEHVRKPLLMIAPGTGVAPMRSLIWERAMWRDAAAEDMVDDLAEAVLIFGGRNSKKDFLYHQDWRDRALDVKVLTAWSRDQKEKIYVQDVVRGEADLVWRLLVQKRGSVLVCGSSGKMPMGVRAAIVDALLGAGQRLDWEYSKEKAEAEVARMERDGRYIQETW